MIARQNGPASRCRTHPVRTEDALLLGELENNHHETCASAGLDATAMCKSAHQSQAFGLLLDWCR
jgi:hypothetical protein